MSTPSVKPSGVSIRGTIRAVLAPRRSLPALLVCAAAIAAQAGMSSDPLAVPIGVAMCAGLMFVAPVSWRVLFGEKARWAHRVVLLGLYASIAVGVVGGVGLIAPGLLGMGDTLLTQPLSLVVCVAMFLASGWGLGRDIGFEEHLALAHARTLDLERRAANAELLALKAHLDPHFLFNTLNAIAEWCVEDGKTAERAVLELAEMLRTILAGVRTEAWPMREELALVETLYALHRLRDPNLFELRMSIDDAARDVSVPPMILLPLAENSIKHGPAAGHRGEIVLEAKRTGDRLVVCLENPGRYRGPRSGSSGIPMVEERLRIAYERSADLKVEGVGERTRVEISMPTGTTVAHA